MPRKGPPVDDEPELWDLVTADVTPMKGRKRAPETVSARPAPARNGAAGDKVVVQRPAGTPPRPAAGPKARDVDLRTRQRLERGQMEIEAVLDLHGDGQMDAREKLVGFLTRAHARDMRCVLVITGKGRDGQGVLRTRLPEWVDEPPLNAIVLKTSPARQGDGGGGAFYVLLRRRRGL